MMATNEVECIALEREKLQSLQKSLNHLNFMIGVVFISINIAIFIKLLRAGNRKIDVFDKTIEIIALLACGLLVISDLISLVYISKKKDELRCLAEKSGNKEIEPDSKLQKASMYFSLAASCIFFFFEIIAVSSLFQNISIDSSELPLSVGSIASTFAFSLLLTSTLFSVVDLTEKTKKSRNQKALDGLKITLAAVTLVDAIIKGLESSGRIEIRSNQSIFSIGYLIAIFISLVSIFEFLYKEMRPNHKEDYNHIQSKCGIDPEESKVDELNTNTSSIAQVYK